MVVLGPQILKVNGSNNWSKTQKWLKKVEIWDNHSESLKNNLYNAFKGPDDLLGGMNLENEIDTCQTTVFWAFAPVEISASSFYLYFFC